MNIESLCCAREINAMLNVNHITSTASAEPLFPSKLSLIDTGGQDFNRSLWGTQLNPQQGLTGKGAWGHAVQGRVC